MRTQALDNFCTWIEQTSLSQTIQVTSWFVPTVQTVHIVAISALMAAMLMINLRALGIVGRDQPLARVSARFGPVIWWMLPVLLGSGILLIVGEPVRELQNWIFQLKMLLVVAAIIVTLFCVRPLRTDAGYWDATGARSGMLKALALLSLALWVGIIFAGRWIAYL
jgi:hypothetical protein